MPRIAKMRMKSSMRATREETAPIVFVITWRLGGVSVQGLRLGKTRVETAPITFAIKNLEGRVPGFKQTVATV